MGLININSKIKTLNEFLIYLLPIALVAGPFLADLFISVSGILFIYQSIYKKDFIYYKNIFFKIFILWCLYIIAVSLFSINPSLSLESSLFYFRFGFFALSVWFVIDNNANFLKNFTYVLSLTFLIILIDGFYQFFMGKNFLGYQYDTMRLSGFFRDEYIFGSYLSRILPLLFGLLTFQFQKSKYAIFFSLILLILSDIIIFLSGERLAFFNLLLSSFLIILFIKNGKMLRIGTLIVSLCAIFIITLSYEPIKYRMIEKTINQIFINENTKKADLKTDLKKDSKNINIIDKYINVLNNKVYIFSYQHQLHYKAAIKIYGDNLIFGAGPKMFRELCKSEKYILWEGNVILPSCSTHPHNTYIQLLSETGIIGFLLIFSLFLILSFNLGRHFLKLIIYKKYTISDYNLCILIAILITLWPFAPSANFFNNWISIIYYLPMGFFLQNYYRHKI